MVSTNNGNGHHIFFTDDEPKIRRMIKKILEQNGLRVSCFGCPKECLRQLNAKRCDLLITDLRLPEMNGIDLMHETRRRNPWLPVLIITGYGDIPTAVKAIRAGANDFIEKPLDKKSFLSKVKSLLPENGNHRHVGQSLTQREKRILKLVLDGKSNREIADFLNRSRRTTEVHRANIKHKLGADSLVDPVKRAAQMGLFAF
jgi:FixJ family two-component response regulator